MKTLDVRLARKLSTAAVIAALGGPCLVSIAAAGVSTVQAAEVSTPSVSIGSLSRSLNGTDISRAADFFVRYTPARGARTGTNQYGTEVAVVNGKISKKESGVGNMVIPAGAYVLSGHGTSGSWLRANAAVGMSVTAPGSTPTPTTPVPPTPPASTTTDTYRTALSSVAGLTHYYPLTAASQARDVVGSVHGAVKGTGVTFSEKGATFTGKGYIELPDSDDFSVASKGGFTVLVDLTVDDWHGAGASEYVHWMGKGVGGAHEWTFRHYVQGGTGEAGARQGRTSFYHFNPNGGLGAGSFFQDPMDNVEHVVTATSDMRQIQMYKDGRLRDTDAMSGYSIVPKNTATPVRIGTRDMSTGYLVGKVRRVAFFNRVLTASEIQRLATAARQ